MSVLPSTLDANATRLPSGEKLAEEMKEKSLAIYNYAREYARERGIIIADTKFEWGHVGDELLLSECSAGPRALADHRRDRRSRLGGGP
mgnify:CR=1 FL=1